MKAVMTVMYAVGERITARPASKAEKWGVAEAPEGHDVDLEEAQRQGRRCDVGRVLGAREWSVADSQPPLPLSRARVARSWSKGAKEYPLRQSVSRPLPPPSSPLGPASSWAMALPRTERGMGGAS